MCACCMCAEFQEQLQLHRATTATCCKFQQNIIMNSESDVVPQLVQSCKVDWFLNFVDSVRRKNFDDFYRRRKFLKAATIMEVYFTVCVMPTTLYAFLYATSTGAILFTVLFFFTLLCVCVSGWMVVFENQLPSSFDPYLNLLRRFHIVSVLIVILLMPCRNIFTSCDFLPEASRNYIMNWHCDIESMVPDYELTLLTLVPIGAIVSFCETRLDFVLALECLSCVLFIVITSWFESPRYIHHAIVSCVLTSLICVDQHQYHLEIYLAYDKLAETLAENKRMQEENRAAELRSMIGNLTHDLKTPLQSFMAGIDVMAHNIHSIIKEMKVKDSKLIVSLRAHFDELQECFRNIRNTNTFMLMTINRCLDYTKVSKGLCLAPKYDTINLFETLSMPLQCMKNIQDRITIEMERIGPEICQYVITDKQWLQENVLCLLSNAVKYSSEGTVTVSITLKSCSEQELLPTEGSVQFASSKRPHSAALAAVASRYVFAPDESNNSSYVWSHNKYKNESDSSKIRAKGFRILPVVSNFPEKEMTSEKNNSSSNNLTIMLPDDDKASMQFLRFEVSDHGIGLTKEAMQNLFHPFQQAQQLAGGTGLGLYSLAKRMDAIHGHYGVAQRRDGQNGSIFWFEIPYRADENFAKMMCITEATIAIGGDEGPIETLKSFPTSHSQNSFPLRTDLSSLSHTFQLQQMNPPSSEVDKLEMIVKSLNISSGRVGDESSSSWISTVTTNYPTYDSSTHFSQGDYEKSLVKESHEVISAAGWNILIADDSATIVKMISMMLRQQHHRVTIAENGDIAIQKISKQWEEHGKGFDLVLMDLQMPVLDGLEATKRYRRLEKEKHRTTQVIVGMSANSDQHTIDAAFVAGVNDFIQKPFQMDTFQIIAKKLIKPTPSSPSMSCRQEKIKK